MKKDFPWYFAVQDVKYPAVWKSALLTLDTNVLLDLYRYHPGTRDALLSAIESFQERVWLSNRAAREFLKNRKAVITEVANEFEKAAKAAGEIERPTSEIISKLRALRIIPQDIVEKFEKEILSAKDRIVVEIEREKHSAPDYLTSDPILERLIKIFADRTGQRPDDLDKRINEAKRRISERIPPGYADKGKIGNDSAGDYLIWREVLDLGKKEGKPIIMVTSEQKEDWWERVGGKTLNARLELLEESFEETGQIFLIYQTDRFLQMHLEVSKKPANPEVLAEIKSQALAREPAISFTHEIHELDLTRVEGKFMISLRREVRNFTVAARVAVAGKPVSVVSAWLYYQPRGCPDVFIRSSVNDQSVVNLHVHSAENGKFLPVGDYLLQFSAARPEDVNLD